MTDTTSALSGNDHQTLSIIVPARNAARTLPALLDDLLDLRMPAGWEKEIIVSYSESSDDTIKVIEARPVMLVHNEILGPGGARNSGTKRAIGSLFYFIDADACPVGTDFFSVLIASAENLGKSGRFGGFGGPVLLDHGQRFNPVAQADHFACWFNWTNLREDEKSSLFQPTVNLVMSSQAFDAVNGFDSSMRVLEDYDIHRRALAAGYHFYFVSNLAVSHRARGTMLKSWRHSWYWGAPYRTAYVEKVNGMEFRIPPDSPWFWLNLPAIFFGRMRQVIRSARKVSTWKTIATLPLIAATVLSWSLAVALGNGQPPGDQPHAE